MLGGLRTMALVFVLAFSLLAGAMGAAPIALHPDNPHYFIWREKTTILVTSGEQPSSDDSVMLSRILAGRPLLACLV